MELSTKVKKLNIFQQLRKKIFLRSIDKIDEKRLVNAPEYIKNDYEVLDNILDKIFSLELDESLLIHFPNEFIYKKIKEDNILQIDRFPVDKLVQISIEHTEIIAILTRNIWFEDKLRSYIIDMDETTLSKIPLDFQKCLRDEDIKKVIDSGKLMSLDAEMIKRVLSSSLRRRNFKRS